MAQNSIVLRSQEDYITPISKEIEVRVTKKLSQEFSRTGNRIFGALSRQEDFLVHPLIQTHSGTSLETFRNAFGTNQGSNGDDSQSDPHSEVSYWRARRHEILAQTMNTTFPSYTFNLFRIRTIVEVKHLYLNSDYYFLASYAWMDKLAKQDTRLNVEFCAFQTTEGMLKGSNLTKKNV